MAPLTFFEPRFTGVAMQM